MSPEEQSHNVALGNAIRQLRKEAKLTQLELAENAGLSVKSLRQIERARVDADWGTVRHLASAMGLTLADLFRLTEKLKADQGA